MNKKQQSQEQKTQKDIDKQIETHQNTNLTTYSQPPHGSFNAGDVPL